MLAIGRRLPPRLHRRLVISWMAHPRAAIERVAQTPASLRNISGVLHRDRSYSLSTAAVAASLPRHSAECGSTLLEIARPVGGVRWVSGSSWRAAKVKVAHGARMETPAIPSFIGIRYPIVAFRRARSFAAAAAASAEKSLRSYVVPFYLMCNFSPPQLPPAKCIVGGWFLSKRFIHGSGCVNRFIKILQLVYLRQACTIYIHTLRTSFLLITGGILYVCVVDPDAARMCVG